jgi:hypothetical protein
MSRSTQWLGLAVLGLAAAVLLGIELAGGETQRWLWCAVWLLLPFLAVALQPRWRPRRRSTAGAPRGLWIGCCVFLLAFAALAWGGARPVRLEGHERVPRNWLGLGPLGDWRYHVGVRSGWGDASQITVVALPAAPRSADSPFVRERRWLVASTLSALAKADASAVALDYHFSEEISDPTVARVVDGSFCGFVRELTRGDATPRPLVFGLGFDERQSPVKVLPTAERLRAADCLGGPTVRQGHLGSYNGAGGVTRSIPLYFRADERWPALSLQVVDRLRSDGAGRSNGSLEHTPGELLHFVRPRTGLVCIGGETLESNEALRSVCERRLRWEDLGEREWREEALERIVLVGSEIGDDHRTPYGTVPGVFVHAWAVHSLRSGDFVRRLPWSLGLVVVAALSLLLAQRLGLGAAPGELLALGGVVLGLQALIAALAMALSLVWIELDVAAVGGGAATLLAVAVSPALRRSTRVARAAGEGDETGRRAPAPLRPGGGGPSPEGRRAAPVFVSYAHEDKEWLRRLLQMLRPLERQGLVAVWSDEEIRAGDTWRPSIERALDEARVAVLLVSPAFLASDFIAHDELPPLLAARRERGVRLLCVHLSACLWEESPLADYQAAHDPSRPLDTLRRAQQNAVLKQIGRELIRAARETA